MGEEKSVILLTASYYHYSYYYWPLPADRVPDDCHTDRNRHSIVLIYTWQTPLREPTATPLMPPLQSKLTWSSVQGL